MKRYLINQNALSDKFWTIEYRGTTQTIMFGKTGTTGRETVKEFTDEEECIRESES